MNVERKRGRATLRASALIILIASTEVKAERTAGGSAVHEFTIARCIRTASEGRPWLEKTLWGLRDQEAGWVGSERPNANGSHDLGPLQVNSWWVSRLAIATGRAPRQVRWWLTHDACFNVAAARWIFLTGLGVTNNYWRAVGVYHSPNARRQQHYVRSVAAKLGRRFGLAVFRQRNLG